MECKDILRIIFTYLKGRDLISCSLVNKKWYDGTNDNYLWFLLFRRELPLNVYPNRKLRRDPRFIYCDEIQYKLFYLSHFRHQYKFELLDGYKETFPSFVAFFFIPLFCCIEIYEYCKSFRKKYEYCDCQRCSYRYYHS